LLPAIGPFAIGLDRGELPLQPRRLLGGLPQPPLQLGELVADDLQRRGEVLDGRLDGPPPIARTSTRISC
jgi:hypothetical protein